MKSKSKESIIVLPNNNELSTGKIKAEPKLLSLISSEYGMEEDIVYFNLHKQKNKHFLKLMCIPSSTNDLHSNNAKIFLMFELIKNGLQNVMRTDENLNIKANSILELINTNDPEVKDTNITKLQSILDDPGELDNIVDLLLSDLQFNSFSYTVLNNDKQSCLLCINSGGIYVRSIDAPFQIQETFLWSDIKNICRKQKKLMIHKNDSEIAEIVCLNKKTSNLAHDHLCRYYSFINNKPFPETISWFRKISLRIRRLFNRRTTSRSVSRPITSVTQEKEVVQPLVSIALPENSLISEDINENFMPNVEQSLQTNSTYDVSLQSDNSYRPLLTSLPNEGPPIDDKNEVFLQKPSNLDLNEHVSIKTTSTYVVNLESPHIDRSGAFENSLSISFGIESKLKRDTLNETVFMENNPSVIKPQESICSKNEFFREMIRNPINEKKLEETVGNETRESNIFTDLEQQEDVFWLNNVNLFLSDSSNVFESTGSKQFTSEIEMESFTKMKNQQYEIIPKELLEDSSENKTTSIILPIEKDIEIQDTKKTLVVEPIKEAEIILQYNETVAEHSLMNILDIPTTLSIANVVDTPEDQSNNLVIKEECLQYNIQLESEQDLNNQVDILPDNNMEIKDEEKLKCSENQNENAASENKDTETVDQQIVSDPNIINVEIESQQCIKSESKLPVSRHRSIPSPKVQRSSRIQIKETPSPNEEEALLLNPIQLFQSSNEKENLQKESNKDFSTKKEICNVEAPSPNFSRFENQECKVDSKTTFTSISAVGDSIVKKSTQTEISSVKSSGIPTPKQYKSTTIITTTIKKPADISKSPINSATKIPTGIPRMSSK